MSLCPDTVNDWGLRGEVLRVARVFVNTYQRTGGEVELFIEDDELHIRPSNVHARFVCRFAKNGDVIDAQIKDEP